MWEDRSEASGLVFRLKEDGRPPSPIFSDLYAKPDTPDTPDTSEEISEENQDVNGVSSSAARASGVSANDGHTDTERAHVRAERAQGVSASEGHVAAPTQNRTHEYASDINGLPGDVSGVSGVSSSADGQEKIENYPEHPPGSIEAEIVALKLANPKRGVDWIKRQVGQPENRVRRVLGLPPHKSGPSGKHKNRRKTPPAPPADSASTETGP
jgi:hypothetical protein